MQPTVSVQEIFESGGEIWRGQSPFSSADGRHINRTFRVDEFAWRRIHELLLSGRSHESEDEISRAKRACLFVFSLFHMSVWHNLGVPLQQVVRSRFIFLQLFLQEFHSRTDSFAEVTKNFRKKQGENDHDYNTHHGRDRPFHRSLIGLLRRVRMGTRRRKNCSREGGSEMTGKSYQQSLLSSAKKTGMKREHSPCTPYKRKARGKENNPGVISTGLSACAGAGAGERIRARDAMRKRSVRPRQDGHPAQARSRSN